MEPEWSDFKVLLALVQAGSISGAARALQVDTSTVSRRLAALEDAVGAQLVIRGGREFSLTPEGRVLVHAAQTMQDAAAQGVRSARSSKSGVESAVRVSVAPGFVPVMLRLLLPALRVQHPDLHVELRGDYQRVDLARGEADVAVRMSRPTESGLVARRALDCGWFVYASEAYLQTHGQPTSVDDLAAHRLVLYAESMHRVAPLRWLEAHRGSARDLSRVDNLELACQTIASDGGIGVLPGFLADPLPQLKRVFDNCIGLNTGWIVYHASARDTARVRLMVDALAAFFEQHAALFSGEPSDDPAPRA